MTSNVRHCHSFSSGCRPWVCRNSVRVSGPTGGDGSGVVDFGPRRWVESLRVGPHHPTTRQTPVDIVRRIVGRKKQIDVHGDFYDMPLPGGTDLGRPLRSTIDLYRTEILSISLRRERRTLR
jgi:hypothetical protein